MNWNWKPKPVSIEPNTKKPPYYEPPYNEHLFIMNQSMKPLSLKPMLTQPLYYELLITVTNRKSQQIFMKILYENKGFNT